MVATSIQLLHYQGNKLSFVLQGQPESQSRPRFLAVRRNVFNAKRVQLAQTKMLIVGLLDQMGSIQTRAGKVERTAYNSNDHLIVKLTMFMRRPNSDTTGVPRRIKPIVLRRLSGWLSKKLVDVDNLAKFTMDAMNGVVYPDDKQVVVLVASKLCDNTDECNGRTVVSIQKITDATELNDYAEYIA